MWDGLHLFLNYQSRLLTPCRKNKKIKVSLLDDVDLGYLEGILNCINFLINFFSLVIFSL